MYPFAQSIFPESVDNETEKIITKMFNDFTKDKNIICWKGNKTLNEIKKSTNKEIDKDIQKISAVSDMQFCKGAGKVLLKGKVRILKSKKTDKIRNIYCDEKHILSMRASDGLFTLKMDGAKLIHKSFKYPKLRVIVDEDAVPFIKDGKSRDNSRGNSILR